MTKHIFTTERPYQMGNVAVFVLVCIFALPWAVGAEITSVTNSVSVSSDGNGRAHASVKTIIDGVVVENKTIDEPGTIESRVKTETMTTSVRTTTEETSAQDEQLLMLIEKLTSLIQYYVLLLNTIS